MTATRIMMVAIVAGVLGRFAHGESAVPSAKGLVQVGALLLFIAALDSGTTEPIARGGAWLFLAAVLLSNNSVLTALAKISNGPVNVNNGTAATTTTAPSAPRTGGAAVGGR